MQIHTSKRKGIDEEDIIRNPENDTELAQLTQTLCQSGRKAHNIVFTDWNYFHAKCMLVSVGVVVYIMSDELLRGLITTWDN